MSAARKEGGGQLPPDTVASLLDWWRLSGVDTIVAETPTPWFAPARLAEAGVPARPAPLASSAVESAPAPESLAELVALLRAGAPNAPVADGDPASGLMIIGEAPSAEDLRTGRPFTGPAGQLLDRMLAAIGRDRRSAYIALLCPRRRLPGPPPADTVAAELPLARAHIRLAAPRVLLLLGQIPARALSGEAAKISELRGRPLTVDAGAGPIPALASFNPAYLLRNPEAKALAWADLLRLKAMLDQPVAAAAADAARAPA